MGRAPLCLPQCGGKNRSKYNLSQDEKIYNRLNSRQVAAGAPSRDWVREAKKKKDLEGHQSGSVG